MAPHKYTRLLGAHTRHTALGRSCRAGVELSLVLQNSGLRLRESAQQEKRRKRGKRNRAASVFEGSKLQTHEVVTKGYCEVKST